MAEKRPRLDIVTPFYNEAESAEAFSRMIDSFEAEVGARFGLSVRKILIDDGSRDGSAAIFARTLSGDWEIVRLSRNFGKEVAVLAGLDRTDGDYVLIMDSDLQHSQDVSLLLVAELLADPAMDVVYATNRREGTRTRGRLSKLFYRLINSSQRYDIPENAGDFRVMRGAVARALTQLRDKRRFNKGLYAWAGFNSKAVPYTPAERVAGVTKWNGLNLLAFSLEAFTSFSVIPLRIVSIIGLMAALFGASYGAKVMFEVIFYGISVPGYPSLAVGVMLFGGLNLAMLGLIGEYVWVTLSESKDRPVYIVREIVEDRSKGERP